MPLLEMPHYGVEDELGIEATGSQVPCLSFLKTCMHTQAFPNKRVISENRECSVCCSLKIFHILALILSYPEAVIVAYRNYLYI